MARPRRPPEPPPPAPYALQLAEAVAAARAAADLLAAEFARPDGPRGQDDKCPADDEAEVLVRDRLLAAFPEYGFVAEEDRAQDRPPSDTGRHAWVVDPNDGTRYFRQGRRGASVSIGLLRDGLPVLGVVLAHTAPTGGEDLFTWAEGSGPVRRNGEVVAAQPPRQGLAAGDVVLVSAAAGAWPLANALLLSPARHRPCASIAYRLALVAAGEAAGTASLQPLDGHDVAAGHALLRGAGLSLLDLAGAEVRYRTAGHSNVGPVVAGGVALARELASRLAHRPEVTAHEAPLDLTEPRPGRPATDVALLRRAQGALLGQLCGDALGSLVEFQSPDEIAEDYPQGVRELVDGGTWDLLAGQPTDDSELALALARTLARCGTFEPVEVARAYARWYESRPFDVGHTTRAALAAAASARQAGRDPAEASRAAARHESKANGALMRVSPLGIFGHGRPPAEVAGWARQDARLTHPNPVCQDASAVFAVAVAQAVAHGGAPAEVADAALAFAREARLHAEVLAALEGARAARPDFVTHQGLVTVALQNAFFQLRHAAPEAALVDTVGRGGDTDTNAAIAGALLGAVHGVLALPLRWRSAVLSCVPVEGAPGVRRPRPPACWPVDALVLAERLAAG
ncbi:MAG: ADP-ribosylglycohydrolase family protein [Anaeromyxobacter sp.]|nr:ADP-ribosylglycohydrolase family protein [Anaeromyxobacter sp.]MBL0275256.1 ADP-ribosylglycohydrolase family protein [Anaeromyxobacter sp.]